MRRDLDYYATPAWCVRRLRGAVGLRGVLLDPFAGDGAIASAWGSPEGTAWRLVEVDEGRAAACGAVCADAFASAGLVRSWSVDAIITNPPYSEAFRAMRWAVEDTGAPVVAMLLRLGILAGAKRAAWLRAHTPHVFVLPNRPSFTGSGTDSSDYAWLVWGLAGPPALEILPVTPRHERARTSAERGRYYADAAGRG